MENSKIKIIFIGTPEFGAIVLEGLLKQVSGFRFQVSAVVTAPDKPVGRKQIITPPPVKVIAEEFNIPVLQPQKILDIKCQIQNANPQLIVVAAYGQILPKEILEIPQYGCLNVHPSLLPEHRGPSPIQTAIFNGDKETGVTIMLMDEKMDHGPIISSISYLVSSIESYEILSKKLAELGAKSIIETIPKWVAGEIKPRPQDETKASYTKILKKEDGEINWENSAEYIEKQIRALNPWPNVYCKLQMANDKSKILKILEAEVLACSRKIQPGKVFLTENGKLAVGTLQNYLILQKLQLEGGKPLSAQDFLRGHREIVGTILS